MTTNQMNSLLRVGIGQISNGDITALISALQEEQVHRQKAVDYNKIKKFKEAVQNLLDANIMFHTESYGEKIYFDSVDNFIFDEYDEGE